MAAGVTGATDAGGALACATGRAPNARQACPAATSATNSAVSAEAIKSTLGLRRLYSMVAVSTPSSPRAYQASVS